MEHIPDKSKKVNNKKTKIIKVTPKCALYFSKLAKKMGRTANTQIETELEYIAYHNPYLINLD